MQPSPDQSPDRHVTVVEAAAILGVTPDAVRSRLRRGSLKRSEAQDGTVLVVLEDNGRDRPDASPTDHPTDRTTVAYIDALKSHINSLEDEVQTWRVEALLKDHLLAAALERIPAIEPPSSPEASESPLSASDAQDGSPTPSDGERPSWLRRFFGL
jgi:hypothetical protein